MTPTTLALLALLLQGGGPAPAPPDHGVTITRPAGAPEGFPRRLEPAGEYIEHTLVPGDSVERVAARYGASKLGVKLANQRLLKAGGWRGGRVIRVKPRRTPPPRRKISYTVQPGDDWTAIAVTFNVRYRDLRTWNWGTRKLRPGRALDVWVDPDVRETLQPHTTLPRPTITIHRDARSRGRPNLGRVTDAVRLPESWLYRLKSPATAWGSSHAIRTILDAIVALRVDHGFHGELIVGSISRRLGRRFRPHVSHQSGRDVDIFLPLLPEVPFSWKPDPFMIDWKAAWALIKAFDATGEVEMILLDFRVQKHLFETARQRGASEAELKRLIGYPLLPAQQRDALVRHGKDHTRHIHVRIKCGPKEDHCYSRWGDPRHREIMQREREAERLSKRRGRAKRTRAPAQ